MNSLCMSAAWVAFWRNKVEILNLYNKQSCPPNFKKRTHSGLKGVFGQEMIAYCMNAILFVRFQNQNNYIYIFTSVHGKSKLIDCSKQIPNLLTALHIYRHI